MQWEKIRNGHVARDASHGRRWMIAPQYTPGGVMLKLQWQGMGTTVDADIADCASFAEAKVFAAALENAEHPAGLKVDQFLVDAGFHEAPAFSRSVSEELMDKVRADSSHGHRYMHHDRRWFASQDRSVFITSTRLGVFPIYCFTVDSERMAKTDSLLIESRVFTAKTATPVIPTFTAAYLEIVKLRVELNGSHLAELANGQEHELVERFDAAYAWPVPMPEPQPHMIGMHI